MESITDLFQLVNSFMGQNYVLFGLFLLGYIIWPGAITKFFKLLEDATNNIKFTLWGRKFDLSETDVDEKINHFLRDWVISLYDKATVIKGDVSAGNISADEAQLKLAGLTDEVVHYFMEKAPADLRQAAIDKFGGDKVAAAEFLFRRVKAIVYDENNSKKN